MIKARFKALTRGACTRKLAPRKRNLGVRVIDSDSVTHERAFVREDIGFEITRRREETFFERKSTGSTRRYVHVTCESEIGIGIDWGV